ncbi:MAG: hypothetical protein PWP45_310 [Tepidanaerobacteraceae bacterium]|nr:hypothetical protein [Tepidanaerobacteraceae bacterium]
MKNQAVKISIIIALLLAIIITLTTAEKNHRSLMSNNVNTEPTSAIINGQTEQKAGGLAGGSQEKETGTAAGSVTVKKKIGEKAELADVKSQTEIRQIPNAKSVSAGSRGTSASSTAVSSEVNMSSAASDKKESAADGSDTTKETDSTSVAAGKCQVEIAIVGKEGRIVYGPAKVAVKENNRWGLTVLGALDSTGVEYNTSPTYAGFVISIAGQANKGMSGWMYKVNDEVPMAAASEKKIKPGDRIIWWYSESISTPSPDWESLVKNSPQN